MITFFKRHLQKKIPVVPQKRETILNLTLDSISFIESSLKIVLPSYYKDFHLSELELILKLRKLEEDDMFYLSTNPEWLISHNQSLFNRAKTDQYLSNKFCIGTDGCGNDSFINLDDNDDNVYFLDHEKITPQLEVDYSLTDSLKDISNLTKFVINRIDMIEYCIRENGDEESSDDEL
jgi:hypothetical protein